MSKTIKGEQQDKPKAGPYVGRTKLLAELRECLEFYADDADYGEVSDKNGRFGAEQTWTTFAGDSSAAKRGLQLIRQNLGDDMEKNDGAVFMSPSTSLLDAVLMANNKWRCEMWALRLHESTPPEVSRMAAIIMDRQLELEEGAKASNARLDRSETAGEKDCHE